MSFDTFYKTEYKKQFSSLEKRYEDEVVNKNGPKQDLKSEFISSIVFEKETILNSRVPFDKKATGYTQIKNQFKEEIWYRFKSYESNFPEKGINGFVEFDIPNFRKKHVENYKKGNEEDYAFDTQFMFDANNEAILEMIAKFNAYDDYRTPDSNVYHLMHDDLEMAEPENKKNPNQGTAAQISIAVIEILRLTKINRSQDQKAVIDLIEFLSGKNNQNIRTAVGKYLKGEIQLTHKKNNTDYSRVLKAIEPLENEVLTKTLKDKQR